MSIILEAKGQNKGPALMDQLISIGWNTDNKHISNEYVLSSI